MCANEYLLFSAYILIFMSEGGEEDDEISIMSPISLVIHSMISSICTYFNPARTRVTRSEILGTILVSHMPIHLGKNKLLTFRSKNIKYQNELPRFRRREATLRANYPHWSFHFETGMDEYPTTLHQVILYLTIHFLSPSTWKSSIDNQSPKVKNLPLRNAYRQFTLLESIPPRTKRDYWVPGLPKHQWYIVHYHFPPNRLQGSNHIAFTKWLPNS